MPEIHSCRECAHCCRCCVFLQYDTNTDLFSCKIYKNKMRRPLPSDRIIQEHKSDFGEEDLIMYLVEEMMEPYFIGNILINTGICHTYKCPYVYMVETTGNKHLDLINKFRKESRQHYKETYQQVVKARKLIPNFDDLVEILNTEM